MLQARMKDKVNIRSGRDLEVSSKVIIDDESYIAETEMATGNAPRIVTRIYHQGAIISTTTMDVSAEQASNHEALAQLMEEHHHRTLEGLKKERHADTMGPDDYLSQANILIRRKSHKNAIDLLAEGVERHPDNAFLLSYHGYLRARVLDEHKEGIKQCQQAIRIMQKKMGSDIEFLHPNLFMNLGRAFYAAGDRQKASEAFYRVYNVNAEDPGLRLELKRMGMLRRPPIFPFLRRTNPVNKYLGRIRHRILEKKNR